MWKKQIKTKKHQIAFVDKRRRKKACNNYQLIAIRMKLVLNAYRLDAFDGNLAIETEGSQGATTGETLEAFAG